MMLRYIMILLFAAGLMVLGPINAKQLPKYPAVKVGILVPIEQQALTEITAGFKDTLKKNYPGQITFLVKNAQGDSNLQRAILQQFKQEKVDLIAPIATMPTQMALAMVRHIPIVGLAAEYTVTQRQQRNPCNITVVDDEISVSHQLQFMSKVIPHLHKITLVHTPSAKIMPQVATCIKVAKQYGITVQDLMVQELSDLYTVSSRIASDSQAVFILKDVVLASGIRTLVMQAHKHQIPVITSDDGTVEKGAAFSIGVKEYQIGADGGVLAAKVLQGTKICKLPIKTIDHLFVFVNFKAAKEQEIAMSSITAAAKYFDYTVVELG